MNQYYSIQGGRRLEGTVTISGAKNAAVAIIPAAILAGQCCILENLPSIQDVQQVFDKVSLFAQPGGLFLFDMNTLYKHQKVLADRVFLYDLDAVFCAWENRLLPDGATVEEQLTFFEKDGDSYFRSDEFITEIAYPVDVIGDAVRKAGLELVAAFDADEGLDTPEQLSPVTDITERILFVARKPL